MGQRNHVRAWLAMAAVTAAFLVTLPARAKYGGGSGTADDPYRITTKLNLVEIRDSPADYSAHFLVTADIDISDIIWPDALIAPDTSREVRFQGPCFSGVFNGGGHKLTGLTIDAKHSRSCLGLFGRLDDGAIVRDLRIEGANITADPNGESVGALAGSAVFAWIENCHATGSITAGDESTSLGGLVGYNGFALTDSSATVNIRTAGFSEQVGGLVGWQSGGLVVNCSATADIAVGPGSEQVGGLTGLNYGTIKNCNATGTVEASGDPNGPLYCTGGLVGWNDGDIENCYAVVGITQPWDGTVDWAGDCLGGLVGQNDDTITSCSAHGNITAWEAICTGGLVGHNGTRGRIKDCYATGNSSSYNHVGGLLGLNWGFVENSYSTGRPFPSVSFVGGLVGQDFGVVQNCFWDTEVSRIDFSDGGTGKTTIEMKQRPTFVDWDFNETWDMVENQTHPFLRFTAEGDLNRDGRVDFTDLAALAQKWLAGVAGSIDEVGCCGLWPGARVELLAESAETWWPETGTFGTIVCCGEDGRALVSWDGCSTPGYGIGLCKSAPLPHKENSAYWMSCDEIGVYAPMAQPELSEALDTTLDITTRGVPRWFSQDETFYYDGDAAQCSNLANRQTAVMATTVQGPGRCEFYCKLSCSLPGISSLRFYVDDVQRAYIFMDVDWQRQSFSVGPGEHELTWRFKRTGDFPASDDDRAWVDKLSYTPEASEADSANK